jgi:hypothetical protein
MVSLRNSSASSLEAEYASTCDCSLDCGRRWLLDEDGSRHARALLPDPAHRVGVRHAEQEEQVCRTRPDREAEPDVVGVDERHRTHRHVQAARRLDQRHHRAVDGEQKLAETQPWSLHSHAALLCPIRL